MTATHDDARTGAAQLLTFAQTARRLGVDVNTVRRWARTEQAPTVRAGRATRIPAAWVDELLGQGWTQ